jgi:iron complex transport system permease protein
VRRTLVVLLCGAALVFAIAFGLSFGSGSARGLDLFASGTRAHFIVTSYRLPRVLLAAVSGAGLAAVGAAFQSLLQNPLAEPYVLGVSGGAALGATLAIALGLGGGFVAAAASVPLCAFLGGLAATALVWALARAGRGGGASILLAGVVVNSIAGACMLFVEALVDPGKLQSLLWWLMGYLDAPAWPQLGFVTAYVACGLAVLFADAARINVLALGEETAASVGIDVRRLERRTLFACAAVVGAIVSVTGLVGFVGLVVPQGMRRVVGPDLRILLPVSAFAGASVLVLCDTLVRLLAPVLHTEVPVGAITSLIGGPVFLVLLARPHIE